MTGSIDGAVWAAARIGGAVKAALENAHTIASFEIVMFSSVGLD
jgi:hypothetical protein